MTDRELLLANQAILEAAVRKNLGVTNASAAEKRTTKDARQAQRRRR